ncbi:MAG: type I glutamate--ammonia ligase [Deltaproteobacteria bacterium]
MTPKEAIAFAKEKGAVCCDIRFQDFLGTWQHFTVPMSEFHEELLEEGSGFDGSSIRGWQPIHASDMLVVPDPTTICMDPFTEEKTVVLIGNIVDPITKDEYSRDPRYVARKAHAYLNSTGIGDTAYFGPEPEFFILDHVRFNVAQNESYFHIDSREAAWNSGSSEFENNLGYKVRNKEGYFPTPPTDTMQDIRTEMCRCMESVGIIVEKHHHEVATAGQAEIDMRFAPMLQMADQLVWFKYIVKNVARRHGMTATFMPKPIFGDNGTGMHVHQSIWKNGKPLFSGDGYGGMSEMAMHYIGGILKHAPALAAITNPTINSYRRLVPGFEAPVNLAYSSRNRSAAVRIPMYSPSPKAKRIEVRFPDPSCNGYLAFAAMLMAGLDGIQKKIDPKLPLDKDIYALTPEELKDVPSLPASLDDALDALAADHEFLLVGDVFTDDVVATWIEYKRTHEINEMRLRPHPYEFELYYDV